MVATVSEKSGKNEFFSRSGKSQRILHLVREIWNSSQSQGKVREIYNFEYCEHQVTRITKGN